MAARVKSSLPIYDNQDDFDGNTEAAAWVAVPASTSTVTLEDYPIGKVAIAAFHDENGNGQHDSSDGLPLEGWGNSGHVSRWTQPTYDAARVSVGIVPVQMHYID